MRCADLEGLLAGLVADDLTPAQAEFVRLHLAECSHCQTAHAGLIRTQRDLSTLDGAYQPRLSQRINQAVARRRTGEAIRSWTGRAARMGAVVAALGLVLFAVLQGPGPRSAGPAAAPVYVIDGHELVEADLYRRTSRRWNLYSTESRFWTDGLIARRGGQELALIDPREPGGVRPVPIASREVAPGLFQFPLSGNVTVRQGSTLWAVNGIVLPRQRAPESPPAFVLDRIDLTTGEMEADLAWKEGRVTQAALSPDGRHAYLLAEVEETWFVKVIGLEIRSLVTAHRPTGGFSEHARMLPSPEGTYLHLLDEGRLLTFDLVKGTIALDKNQAEASRIASLSPDGSRLLTAPSAGGLALLDPRTGEVLQRSGGPAYRLVAWRGSWIYAAHAEGLDLINPASLTVTSSLAIAHVTAWYIP